MFDVLPQKVIHIYANGAPHRVHPIKHFPKSVLVEPNSGKFFMQYWRLAKERGEKRQRAFREYPDIYSLFRSLIQAREQTKRKRIPTLEELKAECADVNILTNTIKAADADAIAQAKASMAKMLEKLENAKTIELKEASEQIECAIIFRDSKNRMNTGVVCARLVATKNRLKERVENILYWLDRYGEWGEAISIFLTFHRQYLPRMEIRLVQLSETEIFENAQRGRNAATIARIENIIREIYNLQFFGGWRKWALQCKKDLTACIVQIRQGKISEAAAELKKVKQATKLKLIQYEIHELLLEIDLGQIEKTIDAFSHAKAVHAIGKKIDFIDETGFRTSIKNDLREELAAAAALLGKGVKPKEIKEAKSRLRTAYQKI